MPSVENAQRALLNFPEGTQFNRASSFPVPHSVRCERRKKRVCQFILTLQAIFYKFCECFSPFINLFLGGETNGENPQNVHTELLTGGCVPVGSQ